MRENNSTDGDGLLQDFIPLVKNGFIILRSILDVLIEKIEEAEHNHRTDIRKETYASIIDALEAEIETVREREEGTRAAKARISAIEAVISVLLREMDNLDAEERRRSKRAHRVKVE